MNKLIKVLLLLLFFNALQAQSNKPDMSFGSIKPEDFKADSYSIDTNAAAVYLFDVGSNYFHENASGQYEEVYQKHARIRILNKNAFDAATIMIPLFNLDEDEQKIEDLQAATYNYSNGKVSVNAIDKNAVFKEKAKNVKVIKFTLPDVKEGSIIEFAFTIRTPGISIPGWNFQGKYPRLWSQYEIIIPYFFDYAVLKQGSPVFKVDSTFSFHTDYSSHAYPPKQENTLQRIWIMQNVPAIAKEPFTPTIDNYIAKLDFQLSGYKDNYGQMVPYNRNWKDVCSRLMRSTAFGYDMTNENKWLNTVVKLATGSATQDLERAKNIFNYVRDNFTCTYNESKYLSQELKKTWQAKQGNVADINMLLTAMLMNANLVASPVILSTADNGRIIYEYPVLSKFNYVICQLVIDKKQYLLDASQKYLSFGKIADECYNGYARVINITNPQGIFLSPNSLNESITTTATISNKDHKAVVTTSLSSQPSIEIKSRLGNTINEEYTERLKQTLFSETTAGNMAIHGVSNADSNLSVDYEVPLNVGNEEVVYFSPLLAVQHKSNPFAAAKRVYPVELSYCKEESYHLMMEVPQGYEVEELPKATQMHTKDSSGLFDYSIAKEGNTIQVNVKVKLARAIYQPEEYQELRDFYTDVIKKEEEQIVFKKLK